MSSDEAEFEEGEEVDKKKTKRYDPNDDDDDGG